jgi:hypothetical protein
MAVAARYGRNHIRLAWFHIALAAYWTPLSGADYEALYFHVSRDVWSIFTLWWVWAVALHCALAWGAFAKSEISRRVSVFVGVAMFVWVLVRQTADFPFYSYVAIFMLPLAQWKPAPEPAGAGGGADLPGAAPKRGPLQILWRVLTGLTACGIVAAWGVPAAMALVLLFLALLAFWPERLQPDAPPD